MSDVVSPSSSKRARIGEAPPSREHDEKPRVLSLAKLASAVVAESLVKEYKGIPNEGDDLISNRKEELLKQRSEIDRQLEKLRDEKKTHIKVRKKEVAEKRMRATEEFAVAGAPDKYCDLCNIFYCDAEKRLCGMKKDCRCVAGCPMARLHLGGLWKSSENDEGGSSDELGGEIDDAEYELIKPSPTGYVDCWICTSKFCNRDILRHYKTCRSVASRRCGFRPPTYENDKKKHVCVPGHCGKEIKAGKEAICYPEDALCCTVCCPKCVYYCQNEKREDDWGSRGYDSYDDICGRAMCKECAKKGCLSCYW